MWTWLGLGVLLVTAACAEEKAAGAPRRDAATLPTDAPVSDAPPSDAPRVPDARPADARPPIPPDGPPPPMCTGCLEQKLVVSELIAPTTPQESAMIGCHFEGGDPGIDNALGNILSFLGTQGSFRPNMALASAIRGGNILVLFRAAAPSLDMAGPNMARLDVKLGAKPSPWDPMVAFSGMGMFGIDPSWAGSTLGGMIGAGGAATFGPGHVRLPIQLGGGVPQLNLDLVEAHVSGTLSRSGLMSGQICGLVPQATLENEIAPKLAAIINNAIRGGGGSAGQLCQLFDMDGSCGMDCANNPPRMDCISGAELLGNALVGNLFRPDVTLADGSKGLSMGVKFTAVGATF